MTTAEIINFQEKIQKIKNKIKEKPKESTEELIDPTTLVDIDEILDELQDHFDEQMSRETTVGAVFITFYEDNAYTTTFGGVAPCDIMIDALKDVTRDLQKQLRDFNNEQNLE